MRLARLAEHRYIKNNLNEVRHITLNPNGPGVVRVHMIPTKTTWDRYVPYVVILNGQYILPIGLSWAILLDCFIREFEKPNADTDEEAWAKLINRAVTATHKVYPQIRQSDILSELKFLIGEFKKIAVGGKPSGKMRMTSLGEYAKYMTAPHRMDLMISSMKKDGKWHCNQKCLHCYAAGQSGAEVSELNTESWKRIIDVCRRANIPQLTFTGGEPTLRGDLCELIEYAQWFVTRLNTNGRLLSADLCLRLFRAGLDNVQITLYSSDKEIHNALVGADGFDETVQGIINAVNAGLGCSVNTPLCNLNSDYRATLKFIQSLGVKYVTCSGLIPSGNALGGESKATRLTGDEMYGVLQSAAEYCYSNGMEISFTSPGWLTDGQITGLGLKEIPSCGACLSNMAIRPDGEVVPCQSWLSTGSLGNILKTKWKKIWNSATCTLIRTESAKMEHVCQLNQSGKR